MDQHAPGETPAAGPRVLVVEDDRDIRDLLTYVLGAEGYAVREAADGRVGLELLRAWRPDAIVLDLALPGLSGFGFRAAQLADPATAAVPVIVLSAQRNVEAWAESLRADAVLAKPFQVEELLATVRGQVGR
jgi:DNA-binding response OmpR family regulator